MNACSNNHPTDLLTECIAHMHANGILFDGCLKTDGELHRFSRDSKKNQPDEWYRCYQGVSSKGNPYLNCYYGTWSGGQETFTYNSYEANRWVSQEERAEIYAKEEQRKRQLDQEMQEEKKKRIENAQETWDQAIQNPTTKRHTSYLERKQVNAYGIKYRVDYQGVATIVIPLCNVDGELQAVQCIQEDGTKRTYGVKKGNFHVIGVIEAQNPIFISEGYATAASIHQATNSPVVIAFDCGNLKSVVHKLREKYPQAKLVIAADDDRETPGNPGKTKAEEAAKACGCDVIIPIFPEGFASPSNECLTDFNDLHVHFGVGEVKDQLQLVQKIEKQVKSDEFCNQSNSFQFRSAHSLTQQPSKSNWLIKRYIDIGSLCELFGDPGCMKTFLALDMGLSIATGISYHDLPVRKSGTVFYIAGEGFHGIPKRLQAWSLSNKVDLKDVPFFVSNQPAQFLDDVSAKKVILAIEELKEKHGEPTFVVIDTLNRNFGPGDEKDNADMTRFIVAIDTSIRLRYDCTVLILHHPPLNDSKRGRGASALLGALDWAYSLKKDGKVLTLSNTKVKDHEPPPDICFKPEAISLPGWIDEEDGQIMTSCVLKKVNVETTHTNDNKPKLTPPQKVAYNSLQKLCGRDFSDDSEGVHIDDWRSAAYEAGVSTSQKQDTKKKAFQRALDDLRIKKLIKVHNDYCKPCGTRDIDGTLAGHVPD